MHRCDKLKFVPLMALGTNIASSTVQQPDSRAPSDTGQLL